MGDQKNPELNDPQQSWEPEPIAADRFHRPGEWVNINRAPYDRVSGVLFKRAAHIVRVRYEPAAPAPQMPEPWQGRGPAIVRWLFSEQVGSEEHLLEGAKIEFVHDTRLPAGSCTGMQAHAHTAELIYVVAGMGWLYHRPTAGSPVVARVLRPGDAVLIEAGEYHSVANETADSELQMVILGLRYA